jgi:hypothetical protein
MLIFFYGYCLNHRMNTPEPDRHDRKYRSMITRSTAWVSRITRSTLHPRLSFFVTFPHHLGDDRHRAHRG